MTDVNRLDETDLAGPMWCEEHADRSWPHDDCAGPGLWVSNGELARRAGPEILRLQERVDWWRAEHRKMYDFLVSRGLHRDYAKECDE